MTFNYKWESSPGKNHIHSDLTGEDQQMDESANKSVSLGSNTEHVNNNTKGR